MNRCSQYFPAFALALAAWHGQAGAELTVRPFPPQALRGTMQITQPPDLLMNGKPERLSPGARIRGTNNMLVMSAALTGQSLVVNFVRESNGLVHEVWILNTAEAALRRGPTP